MRYEITSNSKINDDYNFSPYWTPPFIDKLVSELKSAEKAAAEKAKSSCGDKSNPKEIMESFREDLKSAREEFKNDREKVEKVGETVRKLAEVKNQAIRKAVEDFKAGKENAIKFLMGQVMSATKGKANPPMVMEMLKKKMG